MNSAELPSPISAQNVSSLLDHSLKVNYKARDARFEVCLYSEATSAFALVSFHFLTFHLLSDLPTLTICQAGHPSPPLGTIILWGATRFCKRNTYHDICHTETCPTVPFAISANASNSKYITLSNPHMSVCDVSIIHLFTYSLSILRSRLMHMHAPYVTYITATGLRVNL